MTSVQVVAHNAEIVERNVCEMWAARAIAHGPDIRSGSFQTIVNLYISSSIQFNACFIEPNALSVRRSASGDKNVGRFDNFRTLRVLAVHADLLPRASLNLVDLRFQQHFDSFVAEQVQQRGSYVAVLSTNELRISLDNRHTRTEASHGLRQFKADVTAAHNDEMFRQSVEIQSLDVIHRLGRCQFRDIRNSCMRSQIKEYTLAGNHS